MEAGEGILDGCGIHVGDEVVEVSERRAAFKRVLGALGRVEGVGGEDARDDAPHAALFVRREVRALLRLDDARHLPHAVVAVRLRVRLKLLVAVEGDVVHVPHDRLGLREHGAVHALEDHLGLGEGVAEDGEEGVVDVAVAEGDDRDEASLDVELVDEEGEFHVLS